ncbi:MAG: LegC family aminotransferase [Vulcanococcus sp.]|jgi:aminotransferase in exopolysaccharide biosynthesis|uniref:LegC family aminotransferase n=1 Tax=Vulcanococcus sp. TaxID=2856995 RepID=UPI0025D593A5|nr:LegC family aminotransferase [Vulcanococcus sp.]MBW0180976.1 LegC family aminotransferase [Vulcanococcus sp.]
MSAADSIQAILEVIRQVAGPSSNEQPIALHEPDFRGTEAWSYVKDCLDTGWVSSAGQWVSRFEKELASTTGAAHAVAVTNGTVALRLALHLVGVEAGDEVLLPPLSFVATANAVAHLGAVPHFVDVELTTLAMDPSVLAERLEQLAERHDGQLLNRQTGRRLAAVLPVHMFGHPANGMALRQVADAWGLPMVEDAAEALGSWRGDTHCGLFGAVGTLSFNGNKLITTGGGGALLTNDDELAKRARHLSTTAKLPHPWAFEHDAVGWNDRMPNLNAALGVAQLEDLERRLQAKRKLTERYGVAVAGLEGVELVPQPAGCSSNHWLVSLRFTRADPAEAERQRLQLLEAAHKVGLLIRPVWKLLHQLPMYAATPRSALPVATDQAQRLVNLPSSPQLLR